MVYVDNPFVKGMLRTLCHQLGMSKEPTKIQETAKLATKAVLYKDVGWARDATNPPPEFKSIMNLVLQSLCRDDEGCVQAQAAIAETATNDDDETDADHVTTTLHTNVAAGHATAPAGDNAAAPTPGDGDVVASADTDAATAMPTTAEVSRPAANTGIGGLLL